MFKKKGILVLGMIILCSVLVYFVRDFQMKSYEKLSANSSQPKSAESTDGEKNKNETESASALGNPKDEENTQTELNKDTGSQASSETNSNNTNAKPAATSKPAPASTSGTSGSTNSNGGTATAAPAPTPTPKPVVPEKPKNLIIIDTTTNRKILETRIEYDGKTLLYDYMRTELDKAGITKRIKSDGYVSMIGNLYDYPSMPVKKAGWELCGWIYYINGSKAGIGTKEYAPKPADTIVWKYWKNAASENNN